VQRKQIDPPPREPVDSDVDLQRLLRPFLGPGVLGGHHLPHLHRRHPADDADRHFGIALLYLAVTAAGALIAVWLTVNATRELVNWRMR
jgi:hypothetical protein